jgi:hypothetical protein
MRRLRDALVGRQRDVVRLRGLGREKGNIVLLEVWLGRGEGRKPKQVVLVNCPSRVAWWVGAFGFFDVYPAENGTPASTGIRSRPESAYREWFRQSYCRLSH